MAETDIPECDNCGMVNVPLRDGYCDGCICGRCGRDAGEAGGSMNDMGWCDACESLMNMTDKEAAEAVASGKVPPPKTEREPDQIVFPNGIRAISVDRRNRCIQVILLEGWSVFAITSDSGVAAQIEAKTLKDKNYPCTVKVTARRIHPKPVVEGLEEGSARRAARRGLPHGD